MKKKLRNGTGLFLLLMLSLCLQSWIAPVQAQDIIISGIVTDETGDPMPGVNISVAETTTGTISGSDGNYSLSIPKANVKLVFSYIGYITKEINTNGSATIHVTMQEDISEIDEVTVIGYGKASRKDVTGAVQTVKASEMNVAVFSSPAQIPQGKVPGLIVTRSGIPSENLSFVLRSLIHIP